MSQGRKRNGKEGRNGGRRGNKGKEVKGTWTKRKEKMKKEGRK